MNWLINWLIVMISPPMCVALSSLSHHALTPM
jgi:hypothetical protein